MSSLDKHRSSLLDKKDSNDKKTTKESPKNPLEHSAQGKRLEISPSDADTFPARKEAAATFKNKVKNDAQKSILNPQNLKKIATMLEKNGETSIVSPSACDPFSIPIPADNNNNFIPPTVQAPITQNPPPPPTSVTGAAGVSGDMAAPSVVPSSVSQGDASTTAVCPVAPTLPTGSICAASGTSAPVE